MHAAYIASNCTQNMPTEEAPMPEKNPAKFRRVAQNLQDFLLIKTLLFVLSISNMKWIYTALEYYFPVNFVNLQWYFFLFPNISPVFLL